MPSDAHYANYNDHYDAATPDHDNYVARVDTRRMHARSDLVLDVAGDPPRRSVMNIANWVQERLREEMRVDYDVFSRCYWCAGPVIQTNYAGVDGSTVTCGGFCSRAVQEATA